MGKHMQIHSSKKELQQREELQEQLQTVILKNKVLYKTWDDSSPNLSRHPISDAGINTRKKRRKGP